MATLTSLPKRLTEFISCLTRLRPHIRAGRYLVGGVMVTTLLSSVLEGVGVGLLISLLTLLLGNSDPQAGQAARPAGPIRWIEQVLPGHAPGFYVASFCVLVMGAIVAKNAVLYLSQCLSARLRRRVSVNLRGALFQRLQRAEMSIFEQKSAGEISNIFLTEMYRTMLTLDFLVLLAQRSSMAVFYLIVLCFISWPLTLLTVALAGLVGGVIAIFFKRLRQGGEALSGLNRQLGTRLTESFGGVRVVRATDSQDREISRFQAISEAHGTAEEQSLRASALLPPISETVAVAGAMAIVGCAYFFFVREGTMPAPQLMGFGFILLRLLPLVNQIYGVQGNIVYLAPGILEVERWVQTPQFPERPFGQQEFRGLQQAVRFETVGFSYPNGKQALQQVEIEIPCGKTVALVGASGSGKTTVANLLLRFRQPTSGRITVDGQDYWEFSAASWHRSVAVVEQEAFLFHDTLGNNIAYGYPDATPAAIEEAARLANLTDVIKALPEGLNTIIGERGTMLSGGQRQRLAIARALIRQPKILILDEATSALDNLSERLVQEALEAAQQGRTVLVIAHRLTTIRHADNIVVLTEGRVAEQGTWEQLMARGGTFAKLANSVLPDSNLLGV